MPEPELDARPLVYDDERPLVRDRGVPLGGRRGLALLSLVAFMTYVIWSHVKWVSPRTPSSCRRSSVPWAC